MLQTYYRLSVILKYLDLNKKVSRLHQVQLFIVQLIDLLVLMENVLSAIHKILYLISKGKDAKIVQEIEIMIHSKENVSQDLSQDFKLSKWCLTYFDIFL